jgi:hypothetical protein
MGTPRQSKDRAYRVTSSAGYCDVGHRSDFNAFGIEGIQIYETPATRRQGLTSAPPICLVTSRVWARVRNTFKPEFDLHIGLSAGREVLSDLVTPKLILDFDAQHHSRLNLGEECSHVDSTPLALGRSYSYSLRLMRTPHSARVRDILTSSQGRAAHAVIG